MAHCDPTVMVQSMYSPSCIRYTAQPHAPGVLTVLAKVQQHETSEHQGRKPQPTMVALVLSHDSMLVGSAIQLKVRSCWPVFIAILIYTYSDMLVLHAGCQLDKHVSSNTGMSGSMSAGTLLL